MRIATLLAGALALGLAPLSATAGGITIEDAYMRSSGVMARTAAAFMRIVNGGSEDDRLVAAESDIAARIETHTHVAGDGGVMMMRKVEGGFPVPAGGMRLLQRGGDHLMFMGLTRKLAHGDMVRVRLIFEKAGAIELEIPVDLERMPEEGMKMEGMSGG